MEVTKYVASASAVSQLNYLNYPILLRFKDEYVLGHYTIEYQFTRNANFKKELASLHNANTLTYEEYSESLFTLPMMLSVVCADDNTGERKRICSVELPEGYLPCSDDSMINCNVAMLRPDANRLQNTIFSGICYVLNKLVMYQMGEGAIECISLDDIFPDYCKDGKKVLGSMLSYRSMAAV